MPLWNSNTANVAQAPIHTNEHLRANSFNTNALFNNTNPGVLVSNMVYTVYGVSNLAVNAAHNSANAAHLKKNIVPGWSVVRQGMGPATANVVAGGTGYNNTDILVITSTTVGTTNANGSFTTNTTGGIVPNTVKMNSGNPQGKSGMFVNALTTTVAVTNSTGGASAGSTANLQVVLGGRAGRYSVESLVVLPSASSNTTANTAFFPIS